MGAKRGSYRGYNKETYANNYKSTGDHKRIAMQEDTYLSKKFAGKDMYSRVKHGPSEYKMYQSIKFRRRSPYPQEKGVDVNGVVVGIYPNFLLIACGNYNVAVTYADLILGKGEEE